MQLVCLWVLPHGTCIEGWRLISDVHSKPIAWHRLSGASCGSGQAFQRCFVLTSQLKMSKFMHQPRF